ncbi:hypothetical protein AVEN_141875-1 [Araneus ventricosus]|uniref:Uncharacterized protein n=1 Tax=Araneus ventricosus TaxID=182803 RepID=A0A4Y2G8V2_ARAVE|nr:hypothetical protein AVEN_141875-1 [Araneus ventricosus]
MQFRIIVEELCCEPRLHMWKQVKIAQSKVWTVRLMTKQLPSETIQELSIRNGYVGACVGHSQYSPDLAPIYFHLFPRMKTRLATQRFDNDAEVHAGGNAWLKSQSTTFYDDGINKLVNSYDMCLNLFGDYVEKYLKICLSNVSNKTYFLSFGFLFF